MTRSILGKTSGPEAIRPELAQPGSELPPPPKARTLSRPGSASLRFGVTMLWLSLIVLLPLAAIGWQAVGGGWQAFWLAISSHAAVEAFRVTLTASVVVTVFNMDLPFALPTIVTSLVMLAVYGKNSPVGLHLQHTPPGVMVALAFVTLPLVVRAVQPVLLEIDRDVEEAAASLGASGLKVLTSIVLPSLLPAVLSGAGLSFSRCVAEFGSVVTIGGQVPGKTEVSSQWIRALIENDDRTGAAAISIVLLSISFTVLILLRVLGGRTARREEKAAA
jgi:sulfate transport system permease protein